MIYKYVSAKEVISKIYRDLNLQAEIDTDNVIEWSAEALAHINVYQQYCKKSAILKVHDYRAALPCDLHAILQIDRAAAPLRRVDGSFDPNVSDIIEKGGEPGQVNTNYGSGYSVNGPWLTVNFRRGKIYISYLGIITDEEGYPMIPDLVSYKQAIFWYVLKMMIIGGRINHPEFNYDKADMQWKMYCGQAKGAGNMPGIGEANQAGEVVRMLVPNINAFQDFYASRDGNYYSKNSHYGYW